MILAGTMYCDRESIVKTMGTDGGTWLRPPYTTRFDTPDTATYLSASKYIRKPTYSVWPFWTFNTPNATSTLTAGSTADIALSALDAIDVSFNNSKQSATSVVGPAQEYGLAALDNIRQRYAGECVMTLVAQCFTLLACITAAAMTRLHS